jgi:hypothetical protein
VIVLRNRIEPRDNDFYRPGDLRVYLKRVSSRSEVLRLNIPHNSHEPSWHRVKARCRRRHLAGE